jgi:transposase
MNENKPERNNRKKYSPQFKDQALERATRDGVSQTAKDLGIAECVLYSWRAKQSKARAATR